MVVVGKESRPGVREVEKGAIRRFAEALGETNPIYFDDSAARAAGYRAVVAPPVFASTLKAGSDLVGEVIAGKQVLLAEQAFELTRPLVAGDVVTVRARVADVQTRPLPVGVAETVIIEHEGVESGGDIVFRGRSTFVLRAYRDGPTGGRTPAGELT